MVEKKRQYTDRWLNQCFKSFMAQTNTGPLMEQIIQKFCDFVQQAHIEVGQVSNLRVELRPYMIGDDAEVSFCAPEHLASVSTLTMEEINSSQFEYGFQTNRHVTAQPGSGYQCREGESHKFEQCLLHVCL